MEQHYSTVIVSRIDESTLKIIWAKHPTRTDTINAFNTIRLHLRQATQPTHIIVDIRKNPVFPLAVTLNGAMQQQNHRYMGMWLILGISPMARLIARTLSSVTNNIEWFDTEAEIHQRLSELQMQDYKIS